MPSEPALPLAGGQLFTDKRKPDFRDSAKDYYAQSPAERPSARTADTFPFALADILRARRSL